MEGVHSKDAEGSSEDFLRAAVKYECETNSHSYAAFILHYSSLPPPLDPLESVAEQLSLASLCTKCHRNNCNMFVICYPIRDLGFLVRTKDEGSAEPVAVGFTQILWCEQEQNVHCAHL